MSLKEQLLKPLSAEALLQHVAFITHAVPSSRVRKHVPSDFDLDTFMSPQGEEFVFVSVGCFKNKGFRWSLFPESAGLDFEQLTYRTYVRYKGHIGVYFFATALSTAPGYLLERALGHDVFQGKFQLQRELGEMGYSEYRCRVHSQIGETSFNLVARDRTQNIKSLRLPKTLSQPQDLARFISYRPHGFLRTSAYILGDQIVRHREFLPWHGSLIEGRFELWERLGILRAAEAKHPVSVIVEPSVQFQFFMPLPCAFLPVDESQFNGRVVELKENPLQPLVKKPKEPNASKKPEGFLS